MIAVLILISIFASGCVQKPTGGGAPRVPISVGLDISRAPALGETAELTFTMTSLYRYTFSNFSGEIVLPEGLEYVSGNLSWEGDLLPNQTVQFKALVKAVKTGEWFVYGRPAGGYSDQIVLLISESGTQMSKNPFPKARKPEVPSRPYVIKLAISGTPYLNNTVELTASVASLVEQPDANMNIFLPEGFKLVEGNTSWTGNLPAVPRELIRADDETLSREVISKGRSPMDVVLFERLPKDKQAEFKIKIKAVKTGEWKIVALPINEPPFDVTCPGLDTTVRMTENGSRDGYTVGGCLHVRVSSDTASVSEIPFPA